METLIFEMALNEISFSYYVNYKMKRCLSFHWQLSLLHYSVTFNISWRIESVNHLLGLKWQSLLNSSFVCHILAEEWKEKQKVIKVQIIL